MVSLTMKPVLKKSLSIGSHDDGTRLLLRGKQRDNSESKKQQKSSQCHSSVFIETTKSNSSDQNICDFYANPTLLFRLILQQEYGSAMRRLAKHPREAKIWVCRARRKDSATSSYDHRGIAKNKQMPFPSVFNPHTQCSSSHRNNEYSYRRLPIHAACQNLSLCGGHVHQNTNSKTALDLRKELEALISQLIVAYPAGCKTADHHGTYPLHACVQNAASTEIISLLLTAAPKIILETDAQGRTPSDWNRITNENTASSNHETVMRTSRKHRERIQKLLSKGPDYWEFVRQQAIRKRKEKKAMASSQYSKNKDGKVTVETGQASQLDDTSTIWTEHGGSKDKSIYSAGNMSETCFRNTVESLPMYQLEQQCLMLEQYITESVAQTLCLQQNLLRVRQKIREISNNYAWPKQAETMQRTDLYQTEDTAFLLHDRKHEKGDTHPASNGEKTIKVFRVVESIKSQNLELQKEIDGLEDLVGKLLWTTTTSIPASSSTSSATLSFQQHEINPFTQKSPFTGVISSNLSASFPSAQLSSLTSSPMDIILLHPQRPKGKTADMSFVSVPERHFKVNSSFITPPSSDRIPITPQELFRECIQSPTGNSSAKMNSETKLSDHDDEEYYYYTDDDIDEQALAIQTTNPQTVVTTVKNVEESENSEHSNLCRTDLVDYGDHESMDSILAQAEIINGVTLSPALVNAWKPISLLECVDNFQEHQIVRQENDSDAGSEQHCESGSGGN